MMMFELGAIGYEPLVSKPTNGETSNRPCACVETHPNRKNANSAKQIGRYFILMPLLRWNFSWVGPLASRILQPPLVKRKHLSRTGRRSSGSNPAPRAKFRAYAPYILLPSLLDGSACAGVVHVCLCKTRQCMAYLGQEFLLQPTPHMVCRTKRALQRLRPHVQRCIHCRLLHQVHFWHVGRSRDMTLPAGSDTRVRTLMFGSILRFMKMVGHPVPFCTGLLSFVRS